MATSGMKSVKTTYRLSPNEEAALIKQEKERRRKLRIQQVREQERNFASKIRSSVSKRKEEELRNLAQHLKQTWEQEKKEKTDALQRMFERSLGSMGDGHRAASNQPPLAEIRAAQSVKNQHAATQRYNIALKKHKQDLKEQYEREHAQITARRSAIEIEKARAAKIASLPPPVKDPVDDLDDIGKENRVVTVTSGFSTSHYHLKSEYVERAEPFEQEDARAAAQLEEKRAQEEEKDVEREAKERQEKARLRHQHARRQELLQQDYQKLMVELGQMEQADRRRRQAIVANIPHQVFQPPHKRLEDKEEEQQRLEQAFEDMYMANTDYTGDLILALEPKPKSDADLDVTLDSVSDDVGVTLQPLPMAPPETDDTVRRFPRGLDEEEGEEKEEEAKRVVVEEQLRPPRAPLKVLMDRIKSQREEMKKKVVLEVPGGEARPQGEEKETPASPRDSSGGPTSPSLEGSQEASESERSTVDTLETGTLSEDTNKQEEKTAAEDAGGTTLLHPMEQAAKIRSATKIPDVELQKQTQQEIMAREDEQRLRLAEQQLQDHVEHRDHLQMLQDNLLQRQRMLQQQIEEQERQHRQQLQLLQQEHEQQQVGLWGSSLQQRQQMMLHQQSEQEQQQQGSVQQQHQHNSDDTQHKQDQRTPPIRRLIRQLKVSDQQRQQQQAQWQQQFTQQQQRPTHQQGQQHDLTLYHDLPERLPHQQNLTRQQLDKQQQVQQQQLSQQQLQQVQLISTEKGFQGLDQRPSRPVEQEGLIPHAPSNRISELLDSDKFPVAPVGVSQTGEDGHGEVHVESSGFQIPITVHQGHSKEWLQHYRLGIPDAAIKHSQPYSDQEIRQLPSHDTLRNAQRQLQQRRERLMQLYPELKLPPYEPYFKDVANLKSTKPVMATSTDTLTYRDIQRVTHTGLKKQEASGEGQRGELGASADESSGVQEQEAPTIGKNVPTSKVGVSPTMSDIPTVGIGVSSIGTGVPTQTPDVAVVSAADAISTLPSDVLKPSASIPVTGGIPLSEMERQLDQHRQLLLRTRQQLQQQQQQQQQRILDKQRVLAQRIEQQRQEQLARQYGQQVLPRSLPQDLMRSHLGAQGVMTLQSLPQELMTSYSNAQPNMTVPDVQATKVSTFEQNDIPSEKPGQGLLPTRPDGTSDVDQSATLTNQGMYKLPTMTVGQTIYQSEPNVVLIAESPRIVDEAPSFHELSPDSSGSLTDGSDHHTQEITQSPHDEPTPTSAHDPSETQGVHVETQPLQYDWKTILASNTDPHKYVAPVLSVSQPVRVPKHVKPPPVPLRLPQTAEEGAPHELSTIVEMESPVVERFPRGYQELTPVASTPHKSSPPLREHEQPDAESRSSLFFLQDFAHQPTEVSGRASKTATTTDEVDFSQTSTTVDASQRISELSQIVHTDDSMTGPVDAQPVSKGHLVDTPTSAFIPRFAEDVGRGVLSYPSSNLTSTAPTVSVTMAPSIPTPASSITPAPVSSPAIIRIASPATDNDVTSPPADSSHASSLSEYTLLQTQHSPGSSLLSEGSVERFLALAASDSSTIDSLSSAGAVIQSQMLGSDKRSTKSPIIKDFVMGIPPGSLWQPSSQPSSYTVRVVPEPAIPLHARAPRQSIESTEYNLGPVSPQSTWTDTDTQSGSYLVGGAEVLPIFKRQDIPQDGIPMFSDVSLSHYNTSFESGQSIIPTSTSCSGLVQGHPTESIEGFYGSVSPRGQSEQWFVPQQSLDGSGLHQPTGGDTVEHNLEKTVPEVLESLPKSTPTTEKIDDVKDDESSKLSYAGALTEDSHDLSGAIDDTLQEAMRNIVLTESETSKETGMTEEPDLTLVSLSTTLTSSAAPDDVNDSKEKQGHWASEELGSDSLISFLHHEEEMSLESPARSGSDQSGLVGSTSVVKDQGTPTQDTSQDQSISLQEAFSRHKQAFIRSCQSRQVEVKVHAETHKATAFSQTLDSWKRSRGGKAGRSKTPRTAMSPSRGSGVKGQRSGTHKRSGEKTRAKGRTKKQVTVTAADRKAAEEDMYRRNVRLYNQLEEVQTQKLLRQRQKDYATNRQRRKEFEQKLQARLSKLTKQATKPSS